MSTYPSAALDPDPNRKQPITSSAATTTAYKSPPTPIPSPTDDRGRSGAGWNHTPSSWYHNTDASTERGRQRRRHGGYSPERFSGTTTEAEGHASYSGEEVREEDGAGRTGASPPRRGRRRRARPRQPLGDIEYPRSYMNVTKVYMDEQGRVLRNERRKTKKQKHSGCIIL